MLKDARFTPICQTLYLKIYENRDWDVYYSMTKNQSIFNNPFAGMRAERVEFYW